MEYSCTAVSTFLSSVPPPLLLSSLSVATIGHHSSPPFSNGTRPIVAPGYVAGGIASVCLSRSQDKGPLAAKTAETIELRWYLVATVPTRCYAMNAVHVNIYLQFLSPLVNLPLRRLHCCCTGNEGLRNGGLHFAARFPWSLVAESMYYVGWDSFGMALRCVLYREAVVLSWSLIRVSARIHWAEGYHMMMEIMLCVAWPTFFARSTFSIKGGTLEWKCWIIPLLRSSGFMGESR